jgi:hypothetical protein
MPFFPAARLEAAWMIVFLIDIPNRVIAFTFDARHADRADPFREL